MINNHNEYTISEDKLVYNMVMIAAEQETIYDSIELTKLECVQSS